MIRTKITAELSVAGFENLLKELGEIKKEVTISNERFLDESLAYLKQRAQYHINNTVGKTGYIPTGDLANSFSETKIMASGDGWGILRNTAWHAA